MAILIEGMEMPKEYGRCMVIFPDGRVTTEFGSQVIATAVPVPPHGRLIDANALHKLFEDQWHYLQVLDWNENPTAEAKQSGINWCINTMHDDAPAVIPASEEG